MVCVMSKGQIQLYYQNKNYGKNLSSIRFGLHELINHNYSMYEMSSWSVLLNFHLNDTSHFWKLFLAWNIVLHNFSQFWTVFPSFGWEKLGKTGLSQFIPFRTGKTGFGREKPNPGAGPAKFHVGPASFSSFSCLIIFIDELRASKFSNLNAKTATDAYLHHSASMS